METMQIWNKSGWYFVLDIRIDYSSAAVAALWEKFIIRSWTKRQEK